LLYIKALFFRWKQKIIQKAIRLWILKLISFNAPAFLSITNYKRHKAKKSGKFLFLQSLHKWGLSGSEVMEGWWCLFMMVQRSTVSPRIIAMRLLFHYSNFGETKQHYCLLSNNSRGRMVNFKR
jgi:hypothetical protein